MPVIDPNAYSEQEIHQFLDSYAQGAGQWLDFYRGSAGETVINLMAGIGAFSAYKAEIARRELSIIRAKRASSILSIARALGYTVNRKRCAQMNLTIASPLVATISDQLPAIYVNSLPFVVDHPISILPEDRVITVYQGEWHTVDITVPSAEDFKFFTIDNEDPYTIDMNQVFVTINGVVMNTTQYVEEMLDNTYIALRTSMTGGLEIVTGDGIVGYSVNTNDLIHIRYLVTTGLFVEVADDITEAQLYRPQVLNVDVIDRGANEDDIEKIRLLSPRYYQTLRRAVTIADYETIATSYGGVLDAKTHPSTDGENFLVLLSYVREDNSPFIDQEKQTFINYIQKFAIIGQEIRVIDPSIVYVDVHLQINFTGPAGTDLQALMRSALAQYENKLGITFKAKNIERAAYAIPGVNRAYLRSPSTDRTLTYDQYIKINHVYIDLIDDDNILEPLNTDTETGYYPS